MKVIIDTNVLVSAIWRDKNPEAVLLWILAQPDWRWLVSAAILQEYKAVLRRPKFNFPPATLQQWETLLAETTQLVRVRKEPAFPRDQKDAKFLACALASQADYLITGDADFTVARKLGSTTLLSVSMFKRLFIDTP